MESQPAARRAVAAKRWRVAEGSMWGGLDLTWRGWGLPWTTGDGRVCHQAVKAVNQSPVMKSLSASLDGKKKKGAWVGRFCENGRDQLRLSASWKHAACLVLKGEGIV